ncbi:phosphoribosylpyrophosphate synthetase [Hymenobacter sp. H14-R3]|uniref:phosphoribosylpyrophosphate synthetase n=1 Tax=Hymenobacter sp. H14-R3 TaxID=3046308 RepID=UPI0024BB7F4A|nr:phosphoribosylpyrophosphate synthetase [Hymenobacter sp. H14-R3]MDJ0367719.1 phosphoribosylpyrophosphate synthetase [Hymenobacter sp. H14-R3]
MQPLTFDSEAPALRDLARRGYSHNYNLTGAQLADSSLDLHLYPGRFRVREVHRFEGASNPDDMCVVYAIVSDSGVKGVLIDAYGSCADSQTTELMRQLVLTPCASH